MATNPKNQPAPPGPRKAQPAADGRMSDIQKRAQAMANRKPVPPKQFFQEAWTELKKTSWPSREVLIKSTTVVLALVIAVAIWVGVIDVVLTRISNPLFNARP